jgi:hypothetical protein
VSFRARSGRHIWRPKLQWHEDVIKVLQATAKKAACPEATLKYKRLDGSTVQLHKGKKVSDYGINANDQLIVHGIPGEEARPPPPLSMFDSGSFHLRGSDSPRFHRSRPQSASARTRPQSAGGDSWLPTGPTNWP